MSESLVVTAVPRAAASWLNASPHMRRNAMVKPMNRLVPRLPNTTAKYRRRAKTSATDAT
ncbi:hypothetical protein V3C33_04050 [Micrococcaceae bacterium Sec5.7]